MVSPQVTVPIYSIYIVVAAMLSAIILVAAMFYKMRKPIDIDQLDCEQQAQLFRPEKLAPQLIVGTSPRPVQPNSLKTRLSHSIPWKSASQHVIDTLRPECVVENRGKLNFSVAYEKECSTLHVTLLEAVDLPIKDITGGCFTTELSFFLASCPSFILHWQTFSHFQFESTKRRFHHFSLLNVFLVINQVKHHLI